jgi:hypothetical protein
VWTDTLAAFGGRGGRPKPVVVRFAPPRDRRIPIHVQYGVSDRVLMIARGKFEKWLQDQEVLSYQQIAEGLVQHHGATLAKRTLCAGTEWKVAEERVIIIPVVAGSIWEEAMLAYGTVAVTQGEDNG